MKSEAEQMMSEVAQIDPDVAWLERALARVGRLLNDSESLDAPLLQLPIAQMRVVQALYQEGCPPREQPGESMSRLSERLGVRSNALTQAADRLVNHGMAERLSDPDDRRVVRLRLTEKGHELVRQKRAKRRERLARAWAALPAAQRDELLRSVRALLEAGELLLTQP